jgi:adenylate cyclase
VTDAIQVTRETYQRLRGAYVFEERGRIDVKGKGIVTTYLLTGRKSASASRPSGTAGGGSARSP